jgi:hypothetical protein
VPEAYAVGGCAGARGGKGSHSFNAFCYPYDSRFLTRKRPWDESSKLESAQKLRKKLGELGTQDVVRLKSVKRIVNYLCGPHVHSVIQPYLPMMMLLPACEAHGLF